MKEINEILEPYQYSRFGTKVRLLATMFPEPTISINVFWRGKKTLEMPIEDLQGFIEDLQECMRIIEDAIESGEINMDEIAEMRKEYEERNERSSKSSSKSSSNRSSSRKRRSRRRPKRD